MGERIGYVRVSTTEQNTARQEEMMKEWNVDRIIMYPINIDNTRRRDCFIRHCCLSIRNFLLRTLKKEDAL